MRPRAIAPAYNPGASKKNDSVSRRLSAPLRKSSFMALLRRLTGLRRYVVTTSSRGSTDLSIMAIRYRASVGYNIIQYSFTNAVRTCGAEFLVLAPNYANDAKTFLKSF